MFVIIFPKYLIFFEVNKVYGFEKKPIAFSLY
jgi:hypothetical protein